MNFNPITDIKITDYNSMGVAQISVSSQMTGRKAVLTRFGGQRTWVVRGGFVGDAELKVVCHDGNKEKFLKSTAVELAHNWVERGWHFL